MGLVIYTDRFLPVGTAGRALGPVALIRPSYRNDGGLRAHELEHARQFWAAGLVVAVPLVAAGWFWGASAFWMELAFGSVLIPHHALYNWVRWYRLGAEVAAYRAQMEVADGSEITLDTAARRLAREELYGLGLTVDQAKALLEA